MVMENRPVDPGSIQGSHRPISFIRLNIEHARTIFCVKLSINNHIVRLVHKNHIIRRCLMYHAACKVEFQPFTRSYSQLTFFNFYKIIRLLHRCFRTTLSHEDRIGHGSQPIALVLYSYISLGSPFFDWSKVSLPGTLLESSLSSL